MEISVFAGSRSRFLCSTFILIVMLTQSSWCQDSFYFDPAPASQDVLEGDDLHLRCDVSSRRFITFYWTLDGRTLINSTRRFQDSSDLRILAVNRTLDSGSFRCVAVNVSTGIAVRSAEARLNILWLESPALIPQPRQTPVADTSPAAVQTAGDEGVPTELTLKCITEGNPEPSIEWFRNRIRILSTDRFRIQRNRMRIVGVRYADNGVYSCRARSIAGLQAESKDAYLLNLPGPVGSPVLDVDSFTSSVIARKRTSATLNCVFANASSISWYFDQLQLVPNSKYQLHSNGSLTVHQLDVDDVGVYRCAASKSMISAPDQIFAAQLHLAFLDDVTEASFEPRLTSPVVVQLGGKLDVRCRPPSGLPTPTTRWEGPSGPLVGERGRVKITDSTHLVISDIDASDAGEYRCIVENMAATKNKQFSLIVSAPPKIVRGPQTQTVFEGASVTFECRVSGSSYPATIVSWRRDGDAVDTRDTRWRISQSAGTLSINSVRSTDEGDYSCMVNSKPFPSITSSSAHLYVTKRLVFRNKPTDTRLNVGSDVTISCTADGPGTLPPTVTWRRVGYVALPGQVRDVSGQLQFTSVRSTDAGLYVCTATSGDKQLQTIDATIRIDVNAKQTTRPLTANTTVVAGLSAILNCNTASQSINILWTKHGEIVSLDPGRFKILSNGSLYIAVVFAYDSGWYSCVNMDDELNDKHTVYLDVSTENGRLDKSHEPTDDHSSSFSVALETTSGDHMTKTIVIAVCCVVAYLSVMAALTVYCVVHMVRARRMRKLQANVENQQNNTNQLNGAGDKLNGSVNSESVHLMMSMLDQQRASFTSSGNNHKEMSLLRNDLDTSVRSGDSASSPIYNDVSTLPSPTRRGATDVPAFSPSQLKMLGLLGKGDYGDIMLARNDEPNKGQSVVIVKSLLSSSPHHQAVFQHEVELFARGSHHRHVANLVGVCYNLQPPLLVTEYCELGDLKRLLRSGTMPLTVAQRIVICHQAALAVAFCASSQLVHGDIAARNFLVSRSFDVKLSKMAAARGIDSDDYCELGGRLVPLRWLAPETAISGNSSTCSDVWSYAVFVGEVFSNAATPFPGLTNDDVLLALASGSGRPVCPHGYPDVIDNLVDQCSDSRPRHRPSASEIATTLEKILSDLTH